MIQKDRGSFGMRKDDGGSMMKEFNMLASTSRGFENAAISELRFLLEEIGDSDSTVWRTGISGLIAAKTAFDHLEAIEKLRKILLDRPYEFRYTLRLIPIEKVVSTNLADIQNGVRELASRIDPDETFRVTVEKRFTSISTHDIIEAVASTVKNKVNLEKPDKTVLIEVVGGFTGISLLKPNAIISVQKEKLL